jgi:serine/threonine protein kinase
MSSTIETIGQYKIIGQIGSGGMATVYQGYQSKLDRHVAIKVLHTAFAQEYDFLARFEREARIIARLDHPNIVPIHDYDDFEGSPYLTMKYIEGVTLKDILRKGTLSPDDTVAVLAPVADALAYAHEQGVIHRDVKPSNIMIDKRGHPYLTDFGLARIMQAGESSLTTDTVLGTPHYISPEQAKGAPEIDPRADVYSLGVILYEIATGRVPFNHASSHAIIHDHIYTPPPNPREVNPNIEPEVERVLLKALAKKPGERYKTPVELINAYRAALGLASSTVQPLSGVVQSAERAPELNSATEALKEEPHKKISISIGENDDDDDNEDDEDDEKGMTLEERILHRAEKRVRKRRDSLRDIGTQLFFFLLINFAIFDAENWLGEIFEGHIVSPPIVLWFTFIFWGFGIIGQLIDYYNKYGPGRERRERLIQREVEREREKVYGDKLKNDMTAIPMRLTEDGELTDSFIEDIEPDYKNKRRS